MTQSAPSNAVGSFTSQGPDTSPQFIVGMNRTCMWIVRESLDRVGGIFRTREDALHFARHEAGGSAARIVVLSGVVDLFGPLRLDTPITRPIGGQAGGLAP